MRRLLFFVVIAAILFAVVHRYHPLWTHAKSHSGRSTPTVHNNNEHCGTVASVHHDLRDAGQPTFIDLGHPYPDQDFTIVIWSANRSDFNPPPESWRGERVCVTGSVKMHKATPGIVASGPEQVHFDK